MSPIEAIERRANQVREIKSAIQSMTIEEIRQSVRPRPWKPVRGNEKLIYHWQIFEPPTLGTLEEAKAATEAAILRGDLVVIRETLPPHWLDELAVIPLKFGAPRVIVLKPALKSRIAQAITQGEEPTPWNLWRYQWDDQTDLAVTLVKAQ